MFAAKWRGWIPETYKTVCTNMDSYDRCVVPGCSTNDFSLEEAEQEEISFQCFPESKQKRLTWCMAINRDDGNGKLWTKPMNLTAATKRELLVCSKHFPASDWDTTGHTRHLRNNVVPSIFPFNTEIVLEIPLDVLSEAGMTPSGEDSDEYRETSEWNQEVDNIIQLEETHPETVPLDMSCDDERDKDNTDNSQNGQLSYVFDEQFRLISSVLKQAQLTSEQNEIQNIPEDLGEAAVIQIHSESDCSNEEIVQIIESLYGHSVETQCEPRIQPICNVEEVNGKIVLPIRCPSCPASFANVLYLKLHRMWRHVKHTYSCSTCGKNCSRKVSLLLHQRQHRRTRQHSCSYCSKVFFSKTVRKLHERMHGQDRPHKCNKCNEAFNLVCDLKWHHKMHLAIEEISEELHSSGSPHLPHSAPASSVDSLLFNESIEKANKSPRRSRRKVSSPRERAPDYVARRASRRANQKIAQLAVLESQSVVKMEKEENRGSSDYVSTQKVWYSCNICSDLFKQNDLNEHRCTEDLICIICGELFTELADYAEHLILHGDSPFQCYLCSQRFSTLLLFGNHARDHRKKPFKCCKCPNTFCRIGALRKHLRSHLKPRKKKIKRDRGSSIHQCSYCGKICSTSGTLKVHIRRHTGDKPFKCKYCTSSFADHAGLKRHTSTIHSESRPYMCSYCSKSFKLLSHLALHELIHTGSKRFQCPQCGKAFTQRPHLKIHMRTHTGEKPYKCDVCPAAFITPDMLYSHMDNHTEMESAMKRDQANILCQYCPYKAFVQGQLKRHMQCHTENLSFRCTACTATFKSDYCLQKHLRAVHNMGSFSYNFDNMYRGRKPGGVRGESGGVKQCSYCPKTCKTNQALQIHERGHTGERPYQCDTCGKAFRQIQHLKAHIVVHTGEKPYKCNQCPSRYAQYHSLVVHRRTHTGGKPLSCPMCTATFVYERSLKEHKKNFHFM